MEKLLEKGKVLEKEQELEKEQVLLQQPLRKRRCPAVGSTVCALISCKHRTWGI